MQPQTLDPARPPTSKSSPAYRFLPLGVHNLALRFEASAAQFSECVVERGLSEQSLQAEAGSFCFTHRYCRVARKMLEPGDQREVVRFGGSQCQDLVLKTLQGPAWEIPRAV